VLFFFFCSPPWSTSAPTSEFISLLIFHENNTAVINSTVSPGIFEILEQLSKFPKFLGNSRNFQKNSQNFQNFQKKFQNFQKFSNVPKFSKNSGNSRNFSRNFQKFLKLPTQHRPTFFDFLQQNHTTMPAKRKKQGGFTRTASTRTPHW
jgi:hypothetical protein